RNDLIDLTEEEAQTPDLSVRVVLNEDRARSHIPSTIFARRPDTDDLECDRISAPRQFCGVDETPSFVISGRPFGLTLDDVVQAHLGSRDTFDPLPDVFFSTQHYWPNLLFIMWRNFGEHVGGIQLHHAVDELVNPLFIAVHG